MDRTGPWPTFLTSVTSLVHLCQQRSSVLQDEVPHSPFCAFANSPDSSHTHTHTHTHIHTVVLYKRSCRAVGWTALEVQWWARCEVELLIFQQLTWSQSSAGQMLQRAGTPRWPSRARLALTVRSSLNFTTYRDRLLWQLVAARLCGQWTASSVSISLLLDPTHSQGDNENCALLGYYSSSSGDSLWTIRDNLSTYRFAEDGTDRLSRNVGKELPLLAA